MRADVLANMGAYVSHFGAAIATHTGNRVATGVYHVPILHVRIRCVLSNTLPTGPYRGAGRPEAIYRLERLLDVAAAEIGMDPIELRRRNLVPRSAMPYRTAANATYDSGNFVKILDEAIRAADWAGFPKRRGAAQRRGRLLGRGMACHIDTTSGLEPTETVAVEVDAEGVFTLLSGTQAMGQGLATVYAQIAAARLGVALSAIKLVQGDTERVASEVGSYGSRSLMIGGAAVGRAVERLIEHGRKLAAQQLEAAESISNMLMGGFSSSVRTAPRLFANWRDGPSRVASSLWTPQLHRSAFPTAAASLKLRSIGKRAQSSSNASLPSMTLGLS